MTASKGRRLAIRRPLNGPSILDPLHDHKLRLRRALPDRAQRRVALRLVPRPRRLAVRELQDDDALGRPRALADLDVAPAHEEAAAEARDRRGRAGGVLPVGLGVI